MHPKLQHSDSFLNRSNRKNRETECQGNDRSHIAWQKPLLWV